MYSELLAEVKAAGLLEKDPAFYVRRLILLSLIAAGVWLGLAFLAGSGWTWWAGVPIAALLGVISAQYGFIAHEAAHRQVFRSNRLNDRVGLVLANLFAGLSYGFWMRKHNKHHQKPNQIGEDPDIAIRVLSFTPDSRDAKTGVEGWLTRRQGWLFPVLLFFTGFDLLLDSLIAVTRPTRSAPHRVVEFVLMLVRQVTPFVVFAAMFGWFAGAVLWLVQMMAFGFFMGGAFAPNHKGMPLVPEGARLDFFSRQVLTSRNIRPSRWKDNLMGGLNFQVEHHLFPSMARPHLRAAHAIVVRFCDRYEVPLVETGLFESYRLVMAYLSRVGLSDARDPFVCPMVATLRPRS